MDRLTTQFDRQAKPGPFRAGRRAMIAGALLAAAISGLTGCAAGRHDDDPWRPIESVVFPDAAFHGHFPTTWQEWPAEWAIEYAQANKYGRGFPPGVSVEQIPSPQSNGRTPNGRAPSSNAPSSGPIILPPGTLPAPDPAEMDLPTEEPIDEPVDLPAPSPDETGARPAKRDAAVRQVSLNAPRSPARPAEQGARKPATQSLSPPVLKMNSASSASAAPPSSKKSKPVDDQLAAQSASKTTLALSGPLLVPAGPTSSRLNTSVDAPVLAPTETEAAQPREVEQASSTTSKTPNNEALKSSVKIRVDTGQPVGGSPAVRIRHDGRQATVVVEEPVTDETADEATKAAPVEDSQASADAGGSDDVSEDDSEATPNQAAASSPAPRPATSKPTNVLEALKQNVGG